MALTDYESRRNQILLSVIETFIEGALPVGSKMISENCRLGISAATIRNVMGDLEKEGYLTHPHTSAGRVPTPKGYRFYVDHLMTSERLSEADKSMIEEAFRTSEMIERVMERIARLLYEITDEVGLVLCPEAASSVLKQLELIPVREKELLAVFITNTGVVKNALVQLEEEAGKEELIRVSHFLNTELTGMTLADVHEVLYRRLLDERSSFFYICRRAKEIIENSGLINGEGDLYLEGTWTIFDKPEFRSYEKAQPVFLLLEDKKELLGLLKRDAASRGIQVHIDEEPGCKNIKGCSLITSAYRIGGKSCGTLGIIGPTRLNYRRVTAIVQYTAAKLSDWMQLF
ncbi:MAG: heat-inducible transcriptional repressor HrcA [Candidatus Omnitrophota bacterium]